ncbi:6747_t:CDS:2, partial [Racocetra fulgida]
MLNTDSAMFHIGLIPSRWYNDILSTPQEEYNQGFGYAKKAINLALQLGEEDELNELLLDWINKKERKIRDSRLEDETLNISNPYQIRTKGAPKKRLKSVLEIISNTNNKNQCNNNSDKDVVNQGRYICSTCKNIGHNARTCELKKK